MEPKQANLQTVKSTPMVWKSSQKIPRAYKRVFFFGGVHAFYIAFVHYIGSFETAL